MEPAERCCVVVVAVVPMHLATAKGKVSRAARVYSTRVHARVRVHLIRGMRERKPIASSLPVFFSLLFAPLSLSLLPSACPVPLTPAPRGSRRRSSPFLASVSPSFDLPPRSPPLRDSAGTGEITCEIRTPPAGAGDAEQPSGAPRRRRRRVPLPARSRKRPGGMFPLLVWGSGHAVPARDIPYLASSPPWIRCVARSIDG